MTTLTQVAAGASPEVPANENFETLSAGAIFAKRHPGTSGLVWGYYGGLYNGNSIADDDVTLTDDADNYVVVLRSTGVVSVSTSSTNSVDPLYAKLYKLTTADGLVTVELDQRTDANGLQFGAPATATDVAAVTNAASSKATPVDADELPITDSAASFALKKLTWANLKAGVFAAWGALISGATGKTTPVDADAIAIMDSAASNATKSLTFTNLKAFLKTYFDTLYGAIGSGVADGDKGDITVSSSGTVWAVDNDVVTNAKAANMATATIKGRTTAGTGDPEDLTAAQAAAILQGDGLTADLAGFRGIPQNSQSTAYTLVAADAGKHIYHPAADTTARVWTIPANGSVAFPIGTVVTFDNDFGAGALTIAITTDTLVLVGTVGSTGSRTIASGGQATAVKVTSTRWRISGVGLT